MQYRSFGRIKVCGGIKILSSLCGDQFGACIVPAMPEPIGKCQQARRMRTQMFGLTHGRTPFIYRRFRGAVALGRNLSPESKGQFSAV
jgi:hypothetical protein